MGWAEEFVRTVERSGAERPARSSGKAAGDTVRRRNRAIRGYVVSLKNGGTPIPWATTLEQDLMHLFEVDARIVSYARHPEQVRILVDGAIQERLIDFAVSTARGTTRLTLLPNRNPPSGAVVAALADHCARRGLAHAALSEAAIRAQPRLSIAKALLGFRLVEPSEAFLIAAIEAVGRGARTLDDLERALPAWPHARANICAAALRGRLTLDMTRPVSGETAVSLSGRGA